jgi:hypothetical protein
VNRTSSKPSNDIADLGTNTKTGYWSSKKMRVKTKRIPNMRLYKGAHVERLLDEKPAWARHKIITKKSVDKQGIKIQAYDIGRFQIDFADFTNFGDTDNYLLVIIDVFSRFLIAFACKGRDADEYVLHLENFITKWNNGDYVEIESAKEGNTQYEYREYDKPNKNPSYIPPQIVEKTKNSDIPVYSCL